MLANDHGTRALFQAELDAERLRLRANLERLRDTLGEVATKTRSLGASIRRLGATGRDLVTKEQLHAPCDKEGEFFFCRDDGGSPMEGIETPADHSHGAELLTFAGALAEVGPGQRDRWSERVHHEDRPAYERAEADRRKLGRPYTIEYRFSHPVGGELRWARETAWAIRDPASRHMLFGSYILDITEQKRAEEALRASEERYRAVVEDQSEYICRLDRDLTLTFVNGAACRRLRKPRDDLLGVNLLDLLPQDLGQIVRGHLASLRPEQPAVSYELAVMLPDGTTGWEEWTDRAIFEADGQLVEYQSVGRDVTERKRAEARMFHLAHHDAVTDLPNRLLLRDRLDQEFARGLREGTRFAFMMLDLDDFKAVNDQLGHQTGDCLLREVGGRLSRMLRDTDTVARVGGDEFAIIQTGLHDLRGAAVLARKVVAALAEPFLIERRQVRTGTSVGIALFPEDGQDADRLIHSADVALYRAKEQGRGRYCFFAPSHADADGPQSGLVLALHATVAHRELGPRRQALSAVLFSGSRTKPVMMRSSRP